jgi:hypothetical protein
VQALNGAPRSGTRKQKKAAARLRFARAAAFLPVEVLSV